MAWERDKIDTPHYLKCILCGAETRIREKVGEMPHKTPKIVTRAEKKRRNQGTKGAKRTFKGQFSQSQREDKGY